MYRSGVLQYEGEIYSGSKRRLLFSRLLCVRLMVRNRCMCCCACGCRKTPGCRRIRCSICGCYICPGYCLAIELDPSARFAACRWCSRLSCTREPSADAIRDLIASWVLYCLVTFAAWRRCSSVRCTGAPSADFYS